MQTLGKKVSRWCRYRPRSVTHPNAVCVSVVIHHIYIKCVHRAAPSLLTLYVKQSTSCGLSRSKWGMYKSWPCRAVAFKAALSWIQVAFNYNSQSWLSGPHLSNCCKSSSHNLLQENDSPAGEQLFWFRAINASNTLFVESVRPASGSGDGRAWAETEIKSTRPSEMWSWELTFYICMK